MLMDEKQLQPFMFPVKVTTLYSSHNREKTVNSLVILDCLDMTVFLPWKNPQTEEPGGSPWDQKELDTTERLNNSNMTDVTDPYYSFCLLVFLNK